MAVLVSSPFAPASTRLMYIMEDIHLKGGMRCVANAVARDAILLGARTVGMLVWCIEEKKLFQLADDRTTWNVAALGGGGADIAFTNSFTEAVDQEGRRVIGLQNYNKIPKSPGAGYMLQSGPNQTLMWVDSRGNADRGTRQTAVFETPDYLAPGEHLDFNLEMSRTSMLIMVQLNSVDIEVSCYDKKERTDANPYVFRSSANLLVDDGTSIQDGQLVKVRRYGFVANTDNSAFQYWRIKNIGDTPAKPKLTVTFLVLQ